MLVYSMIFTDGIVIYWKRASDTLPSHASDNTDDLNLEGRGRSLSF
jgi:hypothetical protein